MGLGLVAGLALALAACSGADGETAASADGVTDKRSETFAQVLMADPSLSIAAAAFERTGLMGALDGKASTTIFIPSNAAFEALDEQSRKLLEDPQNSAITAAVLRNHMVPGVLDIEAINKAITDAGGEAAIANFGGEVLTLTNEAGGLVVRNAAGQKATIPGRITIVGNGALIAIDAVLVDPTLLPTPPKL
ncbi:fasciclin domain-containing protein [uncultured Erythrobacter sp.]|uniref:fasciclin domain-containing protein n=1 Tax=uncultured Erythrobacter sp. TaxID=263913 RepID=UPI0026597824|nr:fasciclin domain-containing protein [uncultured Erythrobacter sp.]